MATSSTPASPPRTAGAGVIGVIASGNATAGAKAPEDVRDGDTVVDGGGNGILLDATTMAYWLGDAASSRRDTLWGCLWPSVFFLIFAMRFGNGGCRFIMSGPD